MRKEKEGNETRNWNKPKGREVIMHEPLGKAQRRAGRAPQ